MCELSKMLLSYKRGERYHTFYYRFTHIIVSATLLNIRL